MSWPTKAIGAVVDARSGFASGESVADGVVQVRMNNVTVEGAMDWSRTRRVPVPKKGLSGLALERGDILFNATNSPELVGKSAHFSGYDEPVTFSNHFLRLRPTPVIDGRYLAYWLTGKWKAGIFESMCRAWVNQASVSKDQLLALEIPLPPLAEQQRIAAILDQADDLRRKRRKALVALLSLEMAIFIEMFGRPDGNKGVWPAKRIGELGRVITGNTPPRADPDNFGSHIEWIKSDNLNNNEYHPTPATEFLSPKGVQKGRTAPAGSILVTCIAGSPDCIGNAGVLDRECAFNQQINAFVPNKENGDFLISQIRLFKKLVQNASTKSMKGMVSKSRFEQIELIVPPTDLQNSYSQ